VDSKNSEEPMSLRKILFIICLFLATISLSSAFLSTGNWIGMAFALISAPAWLLTRKYPHSGLAPICLLASVSLAAAGLLAGAPALLMIYAAALTLATWDLLSLDLALAGDSSEEQTRRYENRHLQSLGIALGAGLLLATFGRLITLHTPFALLLFLVALAAFGLDRIWGIIKKQKPS